MTQGERMRKLNKHMKIILTTSWGGDDYTVAKTVNTRVPRVGSTIGPEETQRYIDDGYTVEIKSLNG